MNRLHRHVTLPLLFAALGVSAVVALGEPVSPTHSPTVQIVELPAAPEGDAEAATQRASHASWMRLRITFPTVRVRRSI